MKRGDWDKAIWAYSDLWKEVSVTSVADKDSQGPHKADLDLLDSENSQPTWNMGMGTIQRLILGVTWRYVMR